MNDSMLSINMLGQVNISRNGVSITDKLSTKLMALVCLLVLNADREMNRERISAYLWPDSDEEAARYNLRYNLWMVKKLIPADANGQNFIITTKESCRINKNYLFQCDKMRIDSFDPQGKRPVEELIQLKELFKGDFLEGFYLKNCGEFNEMILFERVVCQTKQIEIMKKLIDLYEELNRWEEELQVLHEMMAIEPYNENFAYRILNICKNTGNRAAAINYYKKFEGKLRRELNISPNNDLKLLYRTLTEEHCETIDEYACRNKAEKRKLTIETHCMKGVDFFWAADAVRALLSKADKKYLLELDSNYILDLCYIQNELLLFYEKTVAKEHREIGTVPPVRIVNAFLKFLSHASAVYQIQINIVDFCDMDPISIEILNHVETGDNIEIIK
ncbi:MAG TPA: BTAD domain-containing putative transcriptional regulator [Bacillota bacterium]|nr:BTAD domain-containing putative transcriptional regulator [Bacillota bacterium]